MLEVPAALPQIQLTANAPGKTTVDGPSTWSLSPTWHNSAESSLDIVANVTSPLK